MIAMVAMSCHVCRLHVIEIKPASYRTSNGSLRIVPRDTNVGHIAWRFRVHQTVLGRWPIQMSSIRGILETGDNRSFSCENPLGPPVISVITRNLAEMVRTSTGASKILDWSKPVPSKNQSVPWHRHVEKNLCFVWPFGLDKSKIETKSLLEACGVGCTAGHLKSLVSWSAWLD